MSEPIRIAHLYPREMNMYGDHGNALTLRRRLEWHGYRAEVVEIHPGEPAFPADILIGGGGQDSGQGAVEEALLRIGADLRAMAESGVPMLMVCGMYQLFGHSFRPARGSTLRGVGVLDIETTAGPDRLIGNVIATSPEFGEILGFENHSGLTVLGTEVEPLGRVQGRGGNNGTDRTEGARRRNVIGTYLHGSLLPKNPRIADHLIAAALERRFGSVRLRELDESLADAARIVARSRPR